MAKYRQSTIAISTIRREEEDTPHPVSSNVDIERDGHKIVNPGSSIGSGEQPKAGKIRIDRTRFMDDIMKPPVWLSSLETSFKFISFSGHRDRRGRQSVELACCSCASNPKAKKVNFKGHDSSTFTNHLKVYHKDAYDNFVKNRVVTPATQSSQSERSGNILTHFPTKDNPLEKDDHDHDDHHDLLPLHLPTKYARDDPRQIEFDAVLTQAIVLDSAPFQTVDNPGFRMLVEFLDKRLTVPTRNTLVQRIKKKYEKVTVGKKLMLQSLGEKTLHLIIDIWTSRQKCSVLGIEVQFIKDWKLCRRLLGFLAFDVAHTGLNIKRRVYEHIKSEFGITEQQVASLTADNASNVLAAFEVITTPSPEDVEEEFDWDWEFDLDPTIDEEDAVDVDQLCPTGVFRNSCMAHLLQLAIKDAIRSSELVKEVTAKVNSIVSYFNKSPQRHTDLMKLTSGLTLIKPVATRWNSVHNSLHRMRRVVNKEEGVEYWEAVNDCLRVAREGARLQEKAKIPTELTHDDFTVLRVVADLLNPFAGLTNTFQGDGVTSSCVIFGFLNAITSCQDMKMIEMDDLYGECATAIRMDLHQFKTNLLRSVITRFTTAPPHSGKKTPVISLWNEDQIRHIVTANILNSEEYILAAVLDPRMKLIPFKGILHYSEDLKHKVPSEDAVVSMIKNKIRLLQSTVAQGQTTDSSSLLSEESDADGEPGRKRSKYGSLFDLRKKIVGDGNKIESELDKYLLLPFEEDENANPLEFWQRQEMSYPILSKLAIKYLAMPASSGSVERLFSIAGAIARARRARIKTSLLEQTLSVREYYRQNL